MQFFSPKVERNPIAGITEFGSDWTSVRTEGDRAAQLVGLFSTVRFSHKTSFKAHTFFFHRNAIYANKMVPISGVNCAPANTISSVPIFVIAYFTSPETDRKASAGSASSI